jgi:hypothetical protein
MSIIDLIKEINRKLLALINSNQSSLSDSLDELVLIKTSNASSLTALQNILNRLDQENNIRESSNKMELITGSVTNKLYKYLLINASTKFTVLIDSDNTNMLTGSQSMLIGDNTLYTGVILYPYPGKTFKNVTVSGGNVFGFYA